MSEPISARPARFQGNLNNWITVILGFAIFFMVNYLGYRYYERKDFSQSHYYDLSPKTLSLLGKLGNAGHGRLDLHRQQLDAIQPGLA